MMIGVTGATGQLGRLAIEALLRDRPADHVVAVVRDPAKATDLAERGITVRVADYGSPEDLRAAFEGVDKLLFVSGSEAGRRIPQHRNVIEAAMATGVGHVVYTSAPHAASTDLALAPEHKATEELIKESGVSYTFLRNNWYTENYAAQLDQARQTGTITAAAGEGRVASASRADYAEAAAAVLSGAGHEGQVYELAGDVAWDFPELATTMTELLGSEVTYRAVEPDVLVEELTAAGLDEGTAGFVTALDTSIAGGALADTGDGVLASLIGRPTTPLLEGLRRVA